VRIALTIGVVAVLLAACMPARLLESPGVTGTVVEADGARPVPGATVRLVVKFTGSGKGTSEHSTTTDASGSFSIPPQKVWGILIAGADYFPLQDTLEVIAPGYGGGKTTVRWSVTGRPSVSVGSVSLERSTQGRPNTSLERTRER
jgi:carboxypeptidase family protein